MVQKKYPSKAPRPEDWEEKAAALLKSYGGNVRKRDAAVRRTLAKVKEMQ